MSPKLIDMNERSHRITSVLICLAVFATVAALAFGAGFSTGYATSKTGYTEMKALATGFQTEAVKTQRLLESQVKYSQRLKDDRDRLAIENLKLSRNVDEVLASLEALQEDNASLVTQLSEN